MSKILLALTLTLGLSACSLIPQQYDNNEYEMLARLEANVAMINEDCSTEYVESRLGVMEYDVRTLHSYTFHIPRNKDVHEIINIIKDDVLEFKTQYDKKQGNKMYCTIKTKILLEKIQDAMKAVAGKVRG
jgi:hypothetical protein